MLENKLDRNQNMNLLPTGDIFQTRLEICEDIAQPYQYMALIEGLDAILIFGYVGYISSSDKENLLTYLNSGKD